MQRLQTSLHQGNEMMKHTPTVRLQPKTTRPSQQKASLQKLTHAAKASQPGPLPTRTTANQDQCQSGPMSNANPIQKSIWSRRPKASQPGPLPSRIENDANQNQSQPSPMSTWHPGPKANQQKSQLGSQCESYSLYYWKHRMPELLILRSVQ